MLIEKGLASLKKFTDEDEDLPEEINEWFDIEEEVRIRYDSMEGPRSRYLGFNEDD